MGEPDDEKVLFESTRMRDGRDDLPNIVRVVEVVDELLRVDTADSDDALHGEWWPLRGVGCQIVGRELLAQAARIAELERENGELAADAAIGRKWKEDGSLATWFPITACLVAEQRRELAEMRPKAAAAERFARAHRALDDDVDSGELFASRIVEYQSSRDAILAACPAKGGAG